MRYLFLTHRDDVADHRAFAARFGCERIIHRDDAVGELREAERIVDGDAPVALAEDLVIVPVPGHTRGSCALIYRETYAFTGDHVWATDDETGLEAGADVCWYSWREQQRSMARLAWAKPLSKTQRLTALASIIGARTSAAICSHTRGDSSRWVGPTSRMSATAVSALSGKLMRMRQSSGIATA